MYLHPEQPGLQGRICSIAVLGLFAHFQRSSPELSAAMTLCLRYRVALPVRVREDLAPRRG